MSNTRRPNTKYQEPFCLAIDIPEAADADVTELVMVIPTGKSLRVDQVQYVNPTGLAGHGTNFAHISLFKDSTEMYRWNTDSNDATGSIAGTASEGTIAAATFVDLTASPTDAALVAEATDVLSIVINESGTTTVPAGRVVIRGRWV